MTNITQSNWQQSLDEDGCCLVRGVFEPAEVRTLCAELTAAIDAAVASAAGEASPSIRGKSGKVYAARNILEIFPPATELWRCEPLLSLLRETLGDNFGLVRGLYFDKHPEKSWSLPWHKDLSIAVERNDLPSEKFRNPTKKSGVFHVEAPQEILERMLTLRIHLDEVTEENGPLLVMPGTHKNGKTDDAHRAGDGGSEMRPTLSAAGDVLAMRPLLSHSSGTSHEGTARHRRILHLEFAAERELPDGYAWHTFLAERAVPSRTETSTG